VVFFLIRYWAVDFFWPKKKSNDDSQNRDPGNRDRG
jgi:hypothetical protein